MKVAATLTAQDAFLPSSSVLNCAIYLEDYLGAPEVDVSFVTLRPQANIRQYTLDQRSQPRSLLAHSRVVSTLFTSHSEGRANVTREMGGFLSMVGWTSVFTSTPELVLSRIGNDPDPEVMMRKVNEVYAQGWQRTELQGVAGVRAEGFPSATGR